MTEFGKYLRKLRIDRNETLGDMAKSIGVSASFLSAIETGKKKIPDSLPAKIISTYALSSKQAIELRKCIVKEYSSSNRVKENKNFSLVLRKMLKDVSADELENMLVKLSSELKMDSIS